MASGNQPFTLGEFDLHGLRRRIDQSRSERGLTWAELSSEVGVAASTIRRFGSAVDAEADGVLALIGWLGVAPEEFVVESKVAGVMLPPRGDGVIRVDMAALAQLQPALTQRRLGTRTTIQRLVAAAQELETPVASVTRWSPI